MMFIWYNSILFLTEEGWLAHPGKEKGRNNLILEKIKGSGRIRVLSTKVLPFASHLLSSGGQRKVRDTLAF